MGQRNEEGGSNLSGQAKAADARFTRRQSSPAWRRVAENPFYVLDLPPECSRMEIERQGRKLLGMLEAQMKSAASYESPLGKHERTASAVRQAMADLHDPERRLLHEMWAHLPQDAFGYAEVQAPQPTNVTSPELTPEQLRRRLGWA